MSKTFLFQAIKFCQTVLIQTIQFSISIVFVHTQLNIKTVLFQTIQFSISTQFNSIWSIDRTLSGATTPGQSWPGSVAMKVAADGTIYGDRNETINHIINKCSKLEQKSKRLDTTWEGDSPGIVQEIKIWPWEQMVYAQLRISLGEWETFMGFWDTNGSLILGQTTRPSVGQKKKKKKARELADFTVTADHRVKKKKAKREIST